MARISRPASLESSFWEMRNSTFWRVWETIWAMRALVSGMVTVVYRDCTRERWR